MSSVKDLVKFIEEIFPPQIQEDYDNSGLITGNINKKINGILLTIDLDENIIDEAIEKKCNMIIAHHPIIFRPIKSITGKNYIERTIIKAIKNDIAIYAAHTSVDNSYEGLNKIVANKLELTNLNIIEPKKNLLYKLVTFAPVKYSQKVKKAIFEAGAGHIGNYDSCSFNVKGIGTFRAGENTNPFIGEKNKIHNENEERIETIFPSYLSSKIISTLIKNHPYEEPAYDIYPLKNTLDKFGAGIIGELKKTETEISFLKKIKNKLEIKSLRHSTLLNKKIKKVAICTGAGHFLIEKSIKQNADIFISSEFKYNEYIEAKNRIVLVDAGHYETEIFIKNLFYEIITKNFTNFATKFADKFENPVKYF